jgi:uroporphyrinogen-III synthase
MKQLSRQSVLLTRSEEDCAPWARELERSGITPVIFPCIRCEPLESAELREHIALELPRSDWLVFTSKRGVEIFSMLHREPLPTSLRVAVVGPATADAAVIQLGRADLVSEMGTAASLAQALEARLSGPNNRHLVAVAENAGTTIEDLLTAAGASCTRLNLYRTVPVARREPKFTLSALGADKILLASPSAVIGLTNQVELDIPAAIYTIGPATNEAATAAGLSVTGQATSPGLEGLMEAMK